MTHTTDIEPQASERTGLRIGETVADKYRLERLIGRGGMGAVFAATQVDLGRTVAIKVMLPELLDDEAAKRFSREARVLAGLRSEHVTIIHDLGKLENHSPYIVMEYLEGKDLHQLVRDEGPLQAATAAMYVRQVCHALTEAHLHGIIHRDLKPANLFLTARADGTPLVKLLDFGISKAAATPENGFTATETTTIFGSPSYMSPEQLVSAKAVDLRTDIWALGVTLCELLTGQLPFSGQSLADLTLKIHLSTPTIGPFVPAELREVVERCLQKDPAMRFQSAAELSAALEACYAPDAVNLARSSLPPSLTPPTVRIAPAVTGDVKPAPGTGAPWENTLVEKRTRASRAMAIAAGAGVAIVAIGAVAGVMHLRSSQTAVRSATVPAEAMTLTASAATLAPQPQSQSQSGIASNAATAPPSAASSADLLEVRPIEKMELSTGGTGAKAVAPKLPKREAKPAQSATNNAPQSVPTPDVDLL